MRILTTYFGHESNMTIYENGKISNIELDKISSQKWIMAEGIPYAFIFRYGIELIKRFAFCSVIYNSITRKNGDNR